MLERVLLPTDGREETAVAIDHGLELAERFDASVHVFYVVDVREMETAPQSESTREAGEEHVARVAEKARERDLSVETEVLKGTPSEAIVDYVEEAEIDLVVGGTHGRTGFERYQAGSVAERVVRTCPVPLLTVPLESNGAPYYPYDDILLPTDGSRGSIESIDWAMDVANAYDSTVHVLSVVESTTIGFDIRSPLRGEQLQGYAEDVVADVLDAAREAGVEATSTITDGAPLDEIRDAIDERDADLVVMGTHGRTDIDRYLLGSVAEKTVRKSPVPVMTVRAPDID